MSTGVLLWWPDVPSIAIAPTVLGTGHGDAAITRIRVLFLTLVLVFWISVRAIVDCVYLLTNSRLWQIRLVWQRRIINYSCIILAMPFVVDVETLPSDWVRAVVQSGQGTSDNFAEEVLQIDVDTNFWWFRPTACVAYCIDTAHCSRNHLTVNQHSVSACQVRKRIYVLSWTVKEVTSRSLCCQCRPVVKGRWPADERFIF